MHVVDAPDMHDPANLWRALENQSNQWLVDFTSSYYNCMLSKLNQPYRSIRGRAKTARDAVFAALVALYDAEHPAADTKTDTALDGRS